MKTDNSIFSFRLEENNDSNHDNDFYKKASELSIKVLGLVADSAFLDTEYQAVIDECKKADYEPVNTIDRHSFAYSFRRLPAEKKKDLEMLLHLSAGFPNQRDGSPLRKKYYQLLSEYGKDTFMQYLNDCYGYETAYNQWLQSKYDLLFDEFRKVVKDRFPNQLYTITTPYGQVIKIDD